MSLLVDAYRQNAIGEMEFLEPEDPAKEVAGLEVHRVTFYAGQAAQTLGLRLLPSLAERDLYVEGEHLATLKDEANLVLANISMFMEQARADIESLRSRIQNILSAIERAQQERGGVVIW
jgi:hypothetical protein